MPDIGAGRQQACVAVELFSIGYCTAPLATTEQGATWKKRRFPAGVALIRHPFAGNILFDTGYGASFWQATQPFPERIYRWLTPAFLPENEQLRHQLYRLGVEKPDLVFLSHLHADHASGLFDLEAAAPIYASRAALEGLQCGRIATLAAGCPQILQRQLARRPLIATDTLPVVDLATYGLGAFGAGRDLLRDGLILVVDLPGHGCGQQGLFLPHTTAGAVFLVADAVWSLSALKRNCPPPDWVLRRLGHRAAYLDTFNKLYHFHKQHPQVQLIASHDDVAYPANGKEIGA